ncbi:MAG: N-acetyl-alpha-D-glucosaminyl L-malate synthase BshA [Spirochaetes bacterium]|nr:N-acetyl-alpha-D-glucosaminyl L-malate synthase BshA [Spirochaetota bacterium]
MKIGVTCYPTYGGSGIIATELGVAMARLGHEIHFISSALPVRLPVYEENIFFHEVSGLPYPLFEHPPYTLNLANKMVAVAREYKLDILHVHYAIPHSVSAILARDILGSVKVVTTLHGTDILLVGQDASYFDITRHAIVQSDAVTAVSDYLAETTKRVFSIDKQIHVIKNFIDTGVFSREQCKETDILRHGDEKIIIHVSNFRPVKDIGTLVRAFGKIRESVNAKLVLVGEGPELPAVKTVIDSLGLSKHVRFLGSQGTLPELLASADLFLLSSKVESFGLAVLEAMAMGVPAVSTDSGGIREVIEDGKTGFIVPAGNDPAMAKRAVELLTDDVMRKSFADACVRTVRERFSIDTAVEEYLRVYRG